MDYLLIGIAAVIIIIALMYFRKLYISSQKNKTQKFQKQTGPSFVNCPLCGYPLLKGENLVIQFANLMSQELVLYATKKFHKKVI